MKNAIKVIVTIKNNIMLRAMDEAGAPGPAVLGQSVGHHGHVTQARHLGALDRKSVV
jgi:hypothetical protein